MKAEIKYIEDALINVDMRIISKYGGVEAISDRLMELKDLPKSSGPGATIDGFETWVSDRLSLRRKQSSERQQWNSRYRYRDRRFLRLP